MYDNNQKLMLLSTLEDIKFSIELIQKRSKNILSSEDSSNGFRWK